MPASHCAISPHPPPFFTEPTQENRCFLQAFEWNVPPPFETGGTTHWARLKAVLPDLKRIGVDAIWIPPACKASGGADTTGYDIYDLYDLGEFEQKGTRATKWGSKEELAELCRVARECEDGVGVYFDAVLNHKAGADREEKCQVVEVAAEDRTKEIGEIHEITAWLGFDFPGRGDKYSSMKYGWQHFSGTDWDSKNKKRGIFRIVGENKYWSHSVGTESGNADFLMFADVDFSHPDVQKDVTAWGEWVVRELGLAGFRFDAVQHFSERYLNEFVANLEDKFGKDKLFLVGEFWVGDQDTLCAYLRNMHHNFSLYDTPLVNNFSRISCTEMADLRTVFDDTLVQVEPYNAVVCMHQWLISLALRWFVC